MVCRVRSATHTMRPASAARSAGALLTAALVLTVLPADAAPPATAAPNPSEPVCTLAPPDNKESELPTRCVSAEVSINRAPALGESATVKVTLDSEVAIDRARLSIRLPQGLRITSGDFGAPRKRGLDTVETKELALDSAGRTVTFEVTADAHGPAQIQADVVDLDAPVVQRAAHATTELTVGATAGATREGVTGTRSRAHRTDGTVIRTGSAGRGRPSTVAGQICATGALRYATYDGTWHPGRRFSVTAKGRANVGGAPAVLATGLTGAADGSYKLCFPDKGEALAELWVEIATTSPYWQVTEMAGTTPYVVATAPLTDVPAGTTQAFGTTAPSALHMPAFDAYDVINRIYDVRGSGNPCWSKEETRVCSALKTRWAPGNTDGGYYSLAHRSVFLTDEMPDARHPVVHEAGHNLYHLLYSWRWTGGDCPSPHFLHRASGPACAWTEGFPNAIVGYVMGDGRYYYTVDTWIDLTQTGFQDTSLEPLRTNPDNGDTCECRIAGSMIALWKQLDGGPQQTFRNMDSYSSDNYQEWFNVDRPKSGLPVGATAKDILFDYTVDYRDVSRLEAVTNGSLENKGAGWTWDNGVVGAYGGYQARTGRYYSWMGGNGTAGSDSMSQEVRIPSSGTHHLLEFFMKVQSEEPSRSADDHLDLQVVVGNQTTRVYSWIGGHPADAYTRRVIDLSRFAGKTVTLRWVSTEDDGEQTDFLLDDISVYSTG